MNNLKLITIFAAFVNGGIGYGFSSITVPIGLLYFSNRVLNPALILAEVAVNAYTIFINIKSLARVWRRVILLILGIIPGIIVGSLLLRKIDFTWLKLMTYSFLVPLILMQGFNLRRPINTESWIGTAFGGIIGLLYSMTTISGPPLAIILANEDFRKDDFRAAIGLIRIVESSFTAMVYYSLGLFTIKSIEVFQSILPGVLVAMPLGAFILRKFNPETFRRVCISIDAWLIAYGLMRSIIEGHVIPIGINVAIFICIIFVDLITLVRFLVDAKSAQQFRRAASVNN